MIFNSDRERDGYLEGLRQARAGEHKDHRTIGLLKAAVLPFDHSYQSYMEGLNRGYVEGLNETQTTHKVTVANFPSTKNHPKSTQATPTPMRDSIGHQIEALGDLRKFLEELAETLGSAAVDYDRYLAAVGESGMVERIVHRYEHEFMAPNLNLIRSLIDRIQTEDIPYLKRESEHFEGLGRQ